VNAFTSNLLIPVIDSLSMEIALSFGPARAIRAAGATRLLIFAAQLVTGKNVVSAKVLMFQRAREELIYGEANLPGFFLHAPYES